MKVLIVLRMPSLSSYFESVIHELVKLHEVHILFMERRDSSDLESLMAELARSIDNAKLSYSFDKSGSGIAWICSLYFRKVLNYSSFIQRQTQSAHYVERYRRQLPSFIKWITYLVDIKIFRKSGFLAWLSRIEKKIPCPHPITNRVKEISPDIVLVSPHNKVPGKDLSFIKAAQKLSIPCAVITLSWDNLTSKGVINVEPDLFMVWNEAQRNAAVSHHFVNANTVEIVGATVFDKWLEYSKFDECVERREIMRKIGLQPDAKYVLYLGSAKNITGDESGIINELATELQNTYRKNSNNIKIIVRPHPSNSDYVSRILNNGCIVYPMIGALPASREAKDSFYASMKYAECVVGVNTSGMLDAIVNNKPVIAICDARYRETQEKTQHFKELLAFSCMETACDIRHTVKIIHKLINGSDNFQDRRREFLNVYIRPNGAEQPVSKVIVNLLERLAK